MGDSLDPGGGDVGDVAHAPVEKVTNFLRSVFLELIPLHHSYRSQASGSCGPGRF